MSDSNPLAFIIDDNRDISELFATALQAAEYETEIFVEGSAALKRLRESAPSVIVLDLQLPDIPGMEILETIRTDDRLRGSRVIVVTGEQQMSKSVGRMADLVLLKPISFDQLRDLARRLRPSGS
jgi:DNA-binding response OmpR family regulator